MADIDSEQAQRAGLDLLFGEDYDGEMSQICQDEISANFPVFCVDHVTPTNSEVQYFIVQKLNQRLRATQRAITSGSLNPQFQRLAADIIEERAQLDDIL